MRTFALSAAVAAFALACGCAQIPTTQLNGYTQAFTQAQTASEQVLLDFDQTLKEARAFTEARAAAKAAAKATATTPAVQAPYPLSWAEASKDGAATAPGDIEVRRRAFKVVADYNAVLVQLAEGKSVEEVKAGATGLLTSVDKLMSVAKGAGIPGLSSLVGIVSTLAEQFEKARLREEFVKAVQNGAPIVQRILDVLIADVGSHYDAQAQLLNRERGRLLDEMQSASEAVQAIAAKTNVPAAALAKAEKAVNDQLAVAKAEIPTLPKKIGGGGAKAADYSPVAQAQVQDELGKLDRLGKTYVENIATMKALVAVLERYRTLLQATQASLRFLVKALNEPVDMATSADQILEVAFALRRDLGDLRAARAASK